MPRDLAPPTLVLASASPARLRLLRDAGIAAHVHVSAVDERMVESSLSWTAPDALAQQLADAKARDVAGARSDRQGRELVLGCDSVLDVDGEALGKPMDARDAATRWRLLRGRAADLVTGHALLDVRDGRIDGVAAAVGRTTVRFGRPTDDEVEAYVATGEPLSVAGSFTLDGYGGWFVDGVDGDPSCVVGLSLPLLRGLLRRLGVGVVDMWQRDAAVAPPAHPSHD